MLAALATSIGRGGTAARLPALTRAGPKVAAPAWMSGNIGPLFPTILDNDAYRSDVPGLNAARFACYFATDHSTGSGKLGVAFFETFGGTWTDSGAAIHTGANQREAWEVKGDPVNNRLIAWASDNVATGLYETQNNRLVTSTDGINWTDQGESHHSHHSGYARINRRGSKWVSLGTIWGGTSAASGLAESTDPGNFGEPAFYSQTMQNFIGQGNALRGRFVFVYQGSTYMCGALTAIPTNSNAPSAYIVFPIDPITFLPIATGYQTWLTPGSGDDAVIHNSLCVHVEDDDTINLVYIGRNSGESVNKILLAQGSAGGTPAPFTPYPRKQLYGPTETVLYTWGAANEDPDASIAVSVTGTNASTRPGGYYEIKCGSTEVQDLTFAQTATYNPASYAALSLKLSDVQLDPTTDPTLFWIMFGFRDVADGSPQHGAAMQWVTGAEHGRLIQTNNGSGSNYHTYSLPWLAPTASAWVRNHVFDSIEFVMLDHGTQCALNINGQNVFWRTFVSISLGNLKPFIRLRSNASPYPETYFRFSEWKVSAYT